MAKINVHAGDFRTGKFSQYLYGTFIMALDEMGWTGFKTIKYTKDEIESVEIASEENVKKLGGTLGWGLAGAAVLGPVGLLAGLLLGGKKTEVTFIVVFKDGKKFLGGTDSKTFTAIKASIF